MTVVSRKERIAIVAERKKICEESVKLLAMCKDLSDEERLGCLNGGCRVRGGETCFLEVSHFVEAFKVYERRYNHMLCLY